MLFSVLIPVYNAEKYLKQCMESVLGQTYDDYEIVLMDDGSTDSSAELCDKYQSQHQNVRVVHQKNQGQLITRCNAIATAMGDYCVFLDSDDLLEANALEVLAGTVQQYEMPDMITYSFYYEKEGQEKIVAKPMFPEERLFCGKEEKKELYELFFSSTFLNNVWTKAVKRTVFEGVFPDYRKYGKLRCSEDRLHAMGMVTNANRVVCINTPLYRYRLVPNSVTREFTPNAIERFNTSILYEEEKNYLRTWELELPKWQEKMDAMWVEQMLYVLDLFYKNVKGIKGKNQVILYDWLSFIPVEMLGRIPCNSYLNEAKKGCWKLVVEKDYKGLKKYFLKKQVYLMLRDLKRKYIRV